MERKIFYGNITHSQNEFETILSHILSENIKDENSPYNAQNSFDHTILNDSLDINPFIEDVNNRYQDAWGELAKY